MITKMPSMNFPLQTDLSYANITPGLSAMSAPLSDEKLGQNGLRCKDEIGLILNSSGHLRGETGKKISKFTITFLDKWP
jgi:hypothetical protein